MLSRESKYEADCLKAFRPPITISRPQAWKGGVIFASPHSGCVYPKNFISRSAVPLNVLRRNVDAFIDKLCPRRLWARRCWPQNFRVVLLMLTARLMMFQAHGLMMIGPRRRAQMRGLA